MLLLLISFIAGVLTILAPCVLPVLPVIIGGSISGNTKDSRRPYIIAAALAGSIIAFTLLLKVSTVLINLPPAALTDFSGGLVIVLGAFMVFPEAWEQLAIRFNWEASSLRLLGRSEHNKGQVAGPLLTGIALGPVFSSCSPTYAFILASVLPRDYLGGLFYLIAYSLGLVLTLLVVSIVGRKVISRYAWAIDTHSLFRRIIGVLFVLIGVAIISGHEVQIETWIANHLPFNESSLEQQLLSTQHRSVAQPLSSGTSGVLNVQATPAPQLIGLTNWINSPALSLAQLKGKVVLVDFWTYSCVNCNRAVPYVETWYTTYKKDGFEVIGVHTPEFAFEHIPSNVKAAVKSLGITYPVALDNNYDTWNNYDNDSWPADYLIDKNGDIRYVSLGEGNYNITEEAIQQLLGIHQKLATPHSVVPITSEQTPETYFGTYRTTDGNTQPQYQNGTYTFTPVSPLQSNQWTIGGTWQVGTYNLTSTAPGATLTFSVDAKDVYVVAGSTSTKPSNVTVTLPAANAGDYGPDAPGGVVTINGSKLYHIVHMPQFGATTVTLTVPAGIQLYTFTFGS